jgi:hypothetical protein
LTCCFSWKDVYSYLAKYDLAAAGGRLGPVGVPGLLLAGGVNFYGNQVGFGCDTVINYEVVLADGSIVQANKTSNQDLFWALKGGSSNFGIVTRFDLETIKSPKVWAGSYTVAAEYIDQFLAVCINSCYSYTSTNFIIRPLRSMPRTSTIPRLTLSRLSSPAMLLSPR